MKSIHVFALLPTLVCTPLFAQTPPKIPKPAAFSEKSSPLSAAQKRGMVQVVHPAAGSFSIDRSPVTAGQFAEFLNALGVKTTGRDEPGGNVGPKEIPPQHHGLFLEFEKKPPSTLIDLDNEEANIGTSNGGFKANPGEENKKVLEVSLAGAAAYCAWRGARLPKGSEWPGFARVFGMPEKWAEWAREGFARDKDGKPVPRSPSTGHEDVGFRCASDD